MLAQALAMSVGGNAGESAPATGGDDVSMMTEEEQIAFALRLSMQPAAGPTAVHFSRCECVCSVSSA